MMLRAALLCLCPGLVGCERPCDRTPAGFCEACYGGRDEMKENWLSSKNRVTISVRAEEKDWPALVRVFEQVGKEQNLSFFNTSKVYPDYLRALGLSICSPTGLFINVDERILEEARKKKHGTQGWDPHPGRVVADVRTYRDDFDYGTVSNALIRELREQWPEDVVDEWHGNRNVEP